MNDTEQLVKEALGKLAERTPHPGPTLNALRRKRKRHRNVFMIAAAGVAAVAVLIFAGVIASDRYAPPSPNDAAAALLPTNGQGVALKYAPHWLPEGYVENFRMADREIHRVWVPSGAKGYPFTDGGPQIALIVGGDQPAGGDWQDTSVRGLKAKIALRQGQSPGQTAEVVWQAQDLLKISVRGFADVRQIALQVAESVRADSKVVHKRVFNLDGRDAQEMWGTSSSDWGALLHVGSVAVEVTTGEPAGAGVGTPVTVRGKQGRVFSGGRLVVQDGPVWISVLDHDANEAKLVERANAVSIAPSPDTSWIGQGL
ncbi:hypothetical protein ABZ345_20775 [Lentzea sp. NPDC005914]|uniref:hypothetical protein n=1 Tax=Lentzea sp. NPDC005914 TaxID=3154572 RepID=UPI0033D36EC6